MNRLTFLFFFNLITIFSFAQDVKDTLWLRDGQVLYGSITELDVGVLKFDAQSIGDIEVKHFDILSMYSTSKFYRLRSFKGFEYYGWLFRGDTGEVRIYNLMDTTSVQLIEISTLNSYEDGFPQRWSGLIGAGYSFTRSSNIGRFNIDASAHYKGERVEYDFSANSILTSVDEVVSREREIGSFVGNRFVSQRWSIFSALSYQRNQTLGLLYRTQAGAGMTYRRYLNNRTRFAIGAGAFYNYEENFENVALSSTEAPILFSFRFFKYRGAKVSLIIEQQLFIGITESGRIRNDGEVSLNWELINDLSLNLSLYNNYDSQSPSNGEALFDYGVVTGISYSF
ncbi:MAG: DUF481 domain-containing protein [Flavobacteriia bacterium]|nr:DUF481 domain-containing protein [Flavobacteriia bacterium]